MTEREHRVHAIVVTYNGMRHNWIHKCIDSLLNSSLPVNIIVIDNGSTDGGIDYIRQRYPNIDLEISSKNLGFGKANNRGIKKALEKEADYVLLLNQDAWVETDTIEELIKHHQQHPEYGVLSPIHCNGRGDALDYRFSEYISPQNGCRLLSDLLVTSRQMTSIYDVDFVNAAAWLISRECLRKVGGFSPMFFHYGEDINYCQRVKYHGLEIGVLPFVKIFHDREKEPDTVTFFKGENMAFRALLLKMLNPNQPLAFNRGAKIINKKIVKSALALRGSKVKVYLGQRQLLYKWKNKIEYHLDYSKHFDQFAYIQDESLAPENNF